MFVLSILALALGLSSPAWSGANNGVEFEVTAPYYSKYVSRGMTAIDDPVLQPGASMAYKGFLFNVWGNYNLTNKIDKKDKFTEVDLTAEYTFDLGRFSVPVGLTHYLYPNMTQPNTTEIYAGVAYKWVITPAFKLYQDIGDVQGQYATLSFTYEHDLPAPKPISWKVVPVFQVGWGSAENNKYRYNWGVDSATFTDTMLMVTVPVKIKDTLTITPGIHQVLLPDSEIRDSAGYDGKTYFSLIFGFSF
jgi:hypothetical protein